MDSYEPVSIGENYSASVGDHSEPVQDGAGYDELPSENKWLSPAEFYEQYKSTLPVKARFCYFGLKTQSVENNRSIDIMSAVQEEIIELQMVDNGEKLYTVVQNDSVTYGLLYDPTNAHTLEESVKGLKFETVEEIMAQPSLPLLVCATKAYTGENALSSVGKGEVLLIRKTSQSRASFFKSVAPKSLSVYSITAGRKKTLLPNCAGSFTTMPLLIRLLLKELHHHFPTLSSFKAMVFVESNSVAVPPHLSARIATLTPHGARACLCARMVGNDSSRVTIPITSPLKLRVITPQKDYSNRLLPLPPPGGTTAAAKDRTSAESPIPEYQYMHPASESSTDYEDVSYYAHPRRGLAGIPTTSHVPPKAADVGSASSNCSGECVETLQASQESAADQDQGEVVELRRMVLELQKRCDTYERRMEDMAGQIDYLETTHKRSVEVLGTALEKLSLQINHQYRLAQSGPGFSDGNVQEAISHEHSSSRQEGDNRNALQGLTVDQVCISC